MNLQIIIKLILSSTFITGLYVIFLGFFLRVILSYCKQLWVTSYHQTMTFMILPVTTFIITKVISGNIALSLGMVGALSIVRFRNPVKNPFELVIFFVLITLGITASASLIYPTALAFFVSLIILFSLLLEKLYFNLKKKKLFSFSFSEGEKMITLEVETKKPIEHFRQNSFLLFEVDRFTEKSFIYRFGSTSKKDIQSLHKEIEGKHSDDIISIEYAYN